MALIELAGFTSTLSQALSSSATSAGLEASGAATLNTALGGSGWCYLLIYVNGVGNELVKATAGVNPLITIVRNQENSGAKAFPLGSYVKYAVGIKAIEDTIAAGPGGLSDVTASGIATASTPGAGVRNVDVEAPNFTNTDGFIDISGTYPDYVFDFSEAKQQQDGTVTELVVSGDFNVSTPTTIPNLTLSAIYPTVTGNAVGSYGSGGYIIGLRITNEGRVATADVQVLTNGVYNNAAVTVANGRITSVVAGSASGVTGITAGAGIVVSGPGTSPTIALQVTGITAGSYGGLTFNAYGQVTSIAGGFNPISTITGAPAEVVVTYPVAGSALVTVGVGSTTAQGLLRLSTTGEAVDVTNQTRALTSAGYKALANANGTPWTDRDASTPLSTAALTDVLTSVVISGTPRMMLIIAHVRWSPNTTAFDASIYVNGSPVQGSGGAIATGFRTLMACVENPTGTVELRTTAPGADTVTGDLQLVYFSQIA